MLKNLLQPEAKQEIVERINRLTPAAQRQWGKMNLNQMLYHCVTGFEIVYNDRPATPVKKPGWLAGKLIRFFILNTNMESPREKINIYHEMNVVEQNIDPKNFEEEKARLLDAVKAFPAKATKNPHPFLGEFTTENWARLLYHHLDHHLKQFGV